MISCIRTNSENADFQKLVAGLDEELRILDGDEHVFYAQLNKTDLIKHVIVAYENGMPVGCGAIRAYADDTIEVKRMFVPVTHRGKKISSKVLSELEKWAKELNYKKLILETGKKQIAAIGLYSTSGYLITPNFGKYIGVENSVCFEKIL